MPTYDYRCEKGHVFELFHSMSDEAPKLCPKCGSASKRVPSGGSGLLFKGSGFYITDYRSSSYKERAKADKAGGSDSGSGGAKPEGGSSKPERGASKSEGGSSKPSGGE